MDDDTTGETVERDGSTRTWPPHPATAGADEPDRSGVSRRWLLGAGGAAGAAAVGVAAGATIASASEPDSDPVHPRARRRRSGAVPR